MPTCLGNGEHHGRSVTRTVATKSWSRSCSSGPTRSTTSCTGSRPRDCGHQRTFTPPIRLLSNPRATGENVPEPYAAGFTLVDAPDAIQKDLVQELVHDALR